jgi:alkyl hydroperoxide reductase subunit AhpC
MTRITPELDRRNVKIIGLSINPVDNHAKWAQDIAETQGTAADKTIRLMLTYPMTTGRNFDEVLRMENQPK